MATDPNQYRFECGTFRFSVDADSEEHAWALAEEFMSHGCAAGFEIDHSTRYIYDVAVYPDITHGLMLVDSPNGVPEPPEAEVRSTFTVDECPDAWGHWTVRRADGSSNGDVHSQPTATFYSLEMAEAYVSMCNKG